MIIQIVFYRRLPKRRPVFLTSLCDARDRARPRDCFDGPAETAERIVNCPSPPARYDEALGISLRVAPETVRSRRDAARF